MFRALKITAFLLFSASMVFAQEVRTDPDNYWLQTKTWEDPLSSAQLIESSLTASGLSGENLDNYINRYNQLINNFKNDLSDAIGITIDRWTLWENTKSQKDMNDAFRNWAAVLNNNGNYIDAFNFLNEVSEKYKLKNSNRNLLYNLSYNQLIEFTKNKNSPGAESFLNSSNNTLPEEDLKKLKQILIQEKVSETVKNGSYEQSLPLVRQAYSTSNISRSVWESWITVLHQNKALTIAKSSGWWNAWQFLKNLPPEEKTLNAIVNSTNTAHDNWSFGIHNQFADLYNSRDVGNAEQLLKQALKKDPENKYLLKDLSDLNKLKP